VLRPIFLKDNYCLDTCLNSKHLIPVFGGQFIADIGGKVTDFSNNKMNGVSYHRPLFKFKQIVIKSIKNLART
jgi:hypothetical protein